MDYQFVTPNVCKEKLWKKLTILFSKSIGNEFFTATFPQSK